MKPRVVLAIIAATAVLAATACSRPGAPAPERTPFSFKIGDHVPAGNWTLIVDALSDSPAPGFRARASGEFTDTVSYGVKVSITNHFDSSARLADRNFEVELDDASRVAASSELVADEFNFSADFVGAKVRSGWIGFGIGQGRKPVALVFFPTPPEFAGSQGTRGIRIDFTMRERRVGSPRGPDGKGSRSPLPPPVKKSIRQRWAPESLGHDPPSTSGTTRAASRP